MHAPRPITNCHKDEEIRPQTVTTPSQTLVCFINAYTRLRSVLRLAQPRGTEAAAQSINKARFERVTYLAGTAKPKRIPLHVRRETYYIIMDLLSDPCVPPRRLLCRPPE